MSVAALRGRAVRALRRADAAVAERVAHAVLRPAPPRRLRVGCVFLRWDPERADAAFQHLEAAMRTLHHDVTFCVVDNRAATGAPRHERDVLHVAGDNRWREFSGWDRGIAALREGASAGFDVWLLANDRFGAVESPLLDHVSDVSIEAAWRSECLSGRVDAYPRAVTVAATPLDAWVCSALMIIPEAVMRSVAPLAHLDESSVDAAFDAMRGTGTQNGVLDARHAAYLREWLTGEGTALATRWYRSDDPTARTDEELRAKLAAILNEQGISARAVRSGHGVVDIVDLDVSARLGVNPASVSRPARRRRRLRTPSVVGEAARRRAGVQRFGDVRVRPAFCPVCGGVAAIVHRGGSARESWSCVRCRSSNRQRQVAAVLCRSDLSGRRHRSLSAYAANSGEAVYLAEQGGPLYRALRRAPRFAASEYVDAKVAPGALVDGLRHEDLQRLSFPDNSFDLVVTTDVLEHVPDPYRAHRDILRVLRPGGRHVFTVPFDESARGDDVRAVIDADGEVRHLATPQYHLDPLRIEGVVVFTIFGEEMCERLRELGFEVTVHRLQRPAQGIFGPGALVFEARKPRDSGGRELQLS